MSLALEIINEVIESQEIENQGFVIDTDAKCEWSLRKIQESRIEAQRIINLCQTMINSYQEKIDKTQDALERETSYFTGLLRMYFDTVPQKAKKVTKTTVSYILPSGKLKMTTPGVEYKRDADRLGTFLKENNYKTFYEEKYIPKWDAIKKRLDDEFKVVGDKVVDKTNGLILEGVNVLEREIKFEVEV